MSIVTNYFIKTDGFWKCKLCPPGTEGRYKIDNTGSTSTRKRHLKAVHNIEDVLPDLPKKPKINFFLQLSQQDKFEENVVRFFAEFNIPYRALESDSYIEMLKSYNKSFQVSY